MHAERIYGRMTDRDNKLPLYEYGQHQEDQTDEMERIEAGETRGEKWPDRDPLRPGGRRRG